MFTRAMITPPKAKQAEILSRYRPIAPKPELTLGPESEDNGESLKIKQSPYLQSVWAQLQARPTRTRKRGRTALGPPDIKRHRAAQLLPVFAHGPNGVPQLPVQSLPLVSSTVGLAQPNCMEEPNEEEVDLNIVPVEKDLIGQLQGPVSPSVIAPQPIRPIGSSISVGCINEEQKISAPTTIAQVPKKRQEVEDEMELEALPAIVSDTNNKVRLVNSAYNEMVGQPECSWLITMAQPSPCKITRICGQVMLQFSHHNMPPREDLLSSNGFSCWVTIEWGGANGANGSVRAFCDVIRLSCESRDYAFEWRFHTEINK